MSSSTTISIGFEVDADPARFANTLKSITKSMDEATAQMIADANKQSEKIQETIGKITAYQDLQKKIEAAADTTDRLVDKMILLAKQDKFETKSYDNLLAKMTEVGREQIKLKASAVTMGKTLEGLGIGTKDVSAEIVKHQMALQGVRKELLENIKAHQSSIEIEKQHDKSIYDLIKTAITLSALPMTAGLAGHKAISLGKDSVTEFDQFNHLMAQAHTLVEVSSQDFEKISKSVREMAVEMGVSANDSAKALYQIYSAGTKAGDGVEVLRQATKAAIAGASDVKTASTLGMQIVNGYGLKIKDLGMIYDTIFKTIKLGLTTLPEMSSHFGVMIPIAKEAGIPLSELGAAFATLTVNGINSARASTELQSAIQNLIAPSPQAKKIMTELGIAWHGLIPTISDISKLKLSAEEMRKLIPNIRGEMAILSLANSLKKLNEIALEIKNGAGATEEAYKIMEETPQAKIDKMASAWDELKISIGEALSPAVVAGAKALTNELKHLRSMGEETKAEFFSLKGIFDQLFPANIVLRGFFSGNNSNVTIPDLSPSVISMARNTEEVRKQFADMAEGIKAPALKVKNEIDKAINITDEQIAAFGHSMNDLRQVLKKHVDDQQKSWDVLVKSAENGTKEESRIIGEEYKIRQENLREDIENRLISENEFVNQSTRLTVDEMEKRISEARRYRTEALALVQQEYQVKIDNARRLNLDAHRIEEERLQAQKGILKQVEDAYHASIDKLIAEEKRHTEEAKKLAQERANFDLSIKDKLANLAEKGMSPEQVYADQQKRIAEEQAAAQKALDEKNYDEAKKHSDRMIALAEQSAGSEIKADGKTITVAETIAKATMQIKTAADIADKAFKAQEESHKNAAEALKKEAQTMVDGLTAVENKVNGIDKKLASEHKLIVQVDTEAIKKAAVDIDELQKKIDDANGLKAGLQGQKNFLATVSEDLGKGKIDAVRDGMTSLVQTYTTLVQSLDTFDPKFAEKFDTKDAWESVDTFAQKVLEVEKTVNDAPPMKVNADTSQAESALKAIIDEAKSLDGRVITYTVKQITEGGGGAVSNSDWADYGFARGGMLPGYGGGDKIRALLEAGEFVVNKDAVRRYGPSFMDAINQMQLQEPQRFSSGGGVQLPSLPPPRYASGGLVDSPPVEGVIRLDLSIGGQQPSTVFGSRDQISTLVTALREVGRGLAS
ncbi:MAG: phage tail tape measure protein [Magnetococcales bacterium]|nr:phage tail tape measure protein [Magnetococcales bacterium]